MSSDRHENRNGNRLEGIQNVLDGKADI